MSDLGEGTFALLGVLVGAAGAVFGPWLVERSKSKREREQKKIERAERERDLRAKRLAEFSVEVLEAMRAGYAINGPNVELARVHFVQTLKVGEAEVGHLLRELVKKLDNESDPTKRLDLHSNAMDWILSWLRGEAMLGELKFNI
ncbi:hypothetical protein [Leucobacter sp. GX24907]